MLRADPFPQLSGETNAADSLASHLGPQNSGQQPSIVSATQSGILCQSIPLGPEIVVSKVFFNMDHFQSLCWICYNITSILCFGFLDCDTCGILCSPTRDQTHTPGPGRQSLNHWAAREVPRVHFEGSSFSSGRFLGGSEGTHTAEDISGAWMRARPSLPDSWLPHGLCPLALAVHQYSSSGFNSKPAHGSTSGQQHSHTFELTSVQTWLLPSTLKPQGDLISLQTQTFPALCQREDLEMSLTEPHGALHPWAAGREVKLREYQLCPKKPLLSSPVSPSFFDFSSPSYRLGLPWWLRW